MHEIVEDVRRWRARGERVAIATVVATRRSAPRPVGAKLAVSEGGELGARAYVPDGGDAAAGGVPQEALDRAQALIRAGRSRLVETEGGLVFADVYGPPPRLVVIGAVDTADALCRAAKLLGWETIVADARGKFATPERIPHADRLIVAWPAVALAPHAPDHATEILALMHEET